jgi:hypothetical protein
MSRFDPSAAIRWQTGYSVSVFQSAGFTPPRRAITGIGPANLRAKGSGGIDLPAWLVACVD